MTKQRKLNTNLGDYNDVGGVTEHEAFHLPKVTSGIKKLDDGFDSIYEYENLLPFVDSARAEFKVVVIKHIGETDFNKINKGLKAYARSASAYSEKLWILKASILNAFGEDLLTGRYEHSDEGTKQIVTPGYFENIEPYTALDQAKLIPANSIKYYQKKGIEITSKYYDQFLKSLEQEEEMEESHLYSGNGNYNYYLEERPAAADLMSIYGGLGKESGIYFADQLLTSYSINNRVADHFMVMGDNARRCMVTSEFLSRIDDLFSSFFVCKYFKERQYEFLLLPNRNNLYIHERMSNEILMDFIINERSESFLEDNIPSKEELINIAEDDFAEEE